LSVNELSGGARISFVFHEVFANGVKSVDPFDQVKDADIRVILYNSSGSSPALFVATTAFDLIVKQQIRRLEDPSLKCVTLVYDELVRILQQLLQKSMFKRFPDLKERFYASVIAVFKKAMQPTNKLVQDLIAMETTYINTGHPDFLNGHRAISIIQERLTPRPPNANSPPTVTGTPDPNKRNIVPPSTTPLVGSNVNNFLTEDQGSGGVTGFFGSFFVGGKRKKAAAIEPPPSVLKATGTLSEREYMETEVIKLLIQSYFNIVKRTVADTVPKAIMLNLVAYAKEQLQRELLKELYRTDLLNEMLQESEFTAERRRECVKMIEALQKADEIVSGV